MRAVQNACLYTQNLFSCLWNSHFLTDDCNHLKLLQNTGNMSMYIWKFWDVMSPDIFICDTLWKYIPVFYPRDAMLARVFATATCLSVRPSVCPSHAGIVPSRAKAGSWNVHRLIAHDSSFWRCMIHRKFARGHPKGTCQMGVGWVFSAIFDQYVGT